ncbi:MAG: PEP-CTERM sorting domain-containing protein [Bryobacteraceae bacterium]|nr:PEP-CTERM sorting domain-containing protein [Bryobacteraceae bacterium]
MKRMMIVCLMGALLLGGSASAATISTIMDRNNGGSNGGAVYFDLTVGTSDITITDFTTNTLETVSFGFSVYTYGPGGTFAGNESNSGLWSLVATGSGTGLGANLHSPVTLNAPFVLQANSTYGIALVIGPEAGHDYTNGTGTNQFYSNSDLSLNFGSATNVPFTGIVNNPRVWNGSITYDLGASAIPEPATLTMFAAGLGLLGFFRRRK